MKENLTLTRRTAVVLSDCLMLFLGLYGTVFCLISAIKKAASDTGNELLNGFFAGLSLLVMLCGVVYLV